MPKKNATEPAEAKIAKCQAFVMEEIHRSEINPATYNPRTISDGAKKTLRKGMERFGLVAPLTWNKRTKNLVSGHQRLGTIDAREGTLNYRLAVAVVDVDEKTERELNIFLNNPTAQGDWDLKALEKMLSDGTNMENAGFSQSEIYQLFGDGALKGGDALTAELAEQVRITKDRFDKIKNAKAKGLDSPHFYSLLIFRNEAEREEFCKAIGVDDNRYLNGSELLEKLKAAKVLAHGDNKDAAK
jgi:hypothetical protein